MAAFGEKRGFTYRKRQVGDHQFQKRITNPNPGGRNRRTKKRSQPFKKSHYLTQSQIPSPFPFSILSFADCSLRVLSNNNNPTTHPQPEATTIHKGGSIISSSQVFFASISSLYMYLQAFIALCFYSRLCLIFDLRGSKR